MKNCSKSGEEINEQAKFCKYCGSPQEIALEQSKVKLDAQCGTPQQTNTRNISKSIEVDGTFT